MNTLKMAAANGVKEGITSIAEMIKATYEAEEDKKISDYSRTAAYDSKGTGSIRCTYYSRCAT